MGCICLKFDTFVHGIANTCIVITLSTGTDRPEQTYNVDLDQMLQNPVSDQGLHCLPVIQQFWGAVTDSQMYLFKF